MRGGGGMCVGSFLLVPLPPLCMLGRMRVATSPPPSPCLLFRSLSLCTPAISTALVPLLAAGFFFQVRRHYYCCSSCLAYLLLMVPSAYVCVLGVYGGASASLFPPLLPNTLVGGLSRLCVYVSDLPSHHTSIVLHIISHHDVFQ